MQARGYAPVEAGAQYSRSHRRLYACAGSANGLELTTFPFWRLRTRDLQTLVHVRGGLGPAGGMDGPRIPIGGVHRIPQHVGKSTEPLAVRLTVARRYGANRQSPPWATSGPEPASP
jgi:hypothetical protein